MSALRHLWNIPDPIDIYKDSQIKAMLGIFGKDHERFKANIDSRNFGEELFEFDMASNESKDLKEVGSGKTSKVVLDHINDSA